MNNKALLMAKARAIADSIEKLGDKQQSAFPTCGVGADYNQLLQLTEKHVPSLEPFMPPPVEVEEQTTYASFGEISTYCEQVYQLLAAYSDGDS